MFHEYWRDAITHWILHTVFHIYKYIYDPPSSTDKSKSSSVKKWDKQTKVSVVWFPSVSHHSSVYTRPYQVLDLSPSMATLCNQFCDDYPSWQGGGGRCQAKIWRSYAEICSGCYSVHTHSFFRKLHYFSSIFSGLTNFFQKMWIFSFEIYLFFDPLNLRFLSLFESVSVIFGPSMIFWFWDKQVCKILKNDFFLIYFF